MRRGAGFALLFVVVFTLVLAVRLPLRWVLPLLPKTLHCLQPEGTLWSGGCRGLVLLPTALVFDEFDWAWRPARLLHGRLAFAVRVRRLDASASGVLQWTPGRIEILDAAGVGTLQPGLPPPLAGWTGRVAVEGLRLRLLGGRLDALDGQLEAHGLRSPQGIDWGSYRVSLPRSSGGDIAPGEIASLDGPLLLKGSVAVKPAERSWQLDVRLAVQPGADPALANALGALGAPDAEGLRPLSVAGTY